MGMRQTIQVLSCFATSLTLTGVAYQLSDRYHTAHQTQAGLNWARQVAGQADVLSLNAREAAGEEPLGWAVSVLAQGVDPRPVRIFKIDAGSATAQTETYQLDRNTGAFDYSKILMPEKGRGVRILLQLGYVGFLGARSRIVSDLLTLGFCGLCYLSIYFLIVWKFGMAGERRLRAILSGWVAQAKVVLGQFGAHIRELIRGEQALVKNAGECRDLLLGLEERLANEGRALEDLKKNQHALSQLGQRAEALALSAVIEAARLGPAGKRLAEISEEVHRIVQRQRELAVSDESAAEALSAGLVSCAEEARTATEIAQTVLAASQAITGEVRQTTDVVMEQAKMMKTLSAQLDRQFSGMRSKRSA